MRCPYCGDRRTEVLKTVHRGHSSYRHRRCLYCGSRFSTQERPVRWSRVDRKWPEPRPLRKGWRNRRTPLRWIEYMPPEHGVGSSNLTGRAITPKRNRQK